MWFKRHREPVRELQSELATSETQQVIAYPRVLMSSSLFSDLGVDELDWKRNLNKSNLGYGWLD